MRKTEIDYYPEIAKELVSVIESNLDDEKYLVKPLIGEISSSLRTLIANGYEAGNLLKDYSHSVHKLHLDISIIIENTVTGLFEIVIFEIKRVKALGLAQLSQLIGYCLVSKSNFGILVNVDKNVSGEFSVIIDGDKDLTKIVRIIDDIKIEHQLGVMIWNSKTLKIEYTNSGAIKSIPQLVELIEKNIDN